jgi:hypothetical protein
MDDLEKIISTDPKFCSHVTVYVSFLGHWSSQFGCGKELSMVLQATWYRTADVGFEVLRAVVMQSSVF